MASTNIFQSVEKTKLSYEVANQIAQAINEGRFQPGDTLPPARSLALQFDVSRPIVHEALTILQIQGYISVKHGRGVFVKDPAGDIVNVPIDQWLEENLKLVEDFYKARLIIEPVCAELAARYATKQEIASLHELLTSVESLFTGSNATVLVGPDIDFHSKIASMAGNSYLQKMLNAVIVPENDIRKVILRLPNHQSVTHDDHVEILNAIEKRDPEAAREAMTVALQRPLTAIKEYLKSKGK
ncbi:MAG: FadR family transcriptional regulator [Anaerolineales bacterium]|nr:FadR family transcriptional regulator [Anaerolineales bacterium]